MPRSQTSLLPEPTTMFTGWRRVNLEPCAGNTEESHVDVDSLLRAGVEAFVHRVETDIDEDTEDAVAANEVAPNPGARQVCVQWARRVAPHVVYAPQLKYAAFAEEDGGVTLVLQSLITDRRLTCRVGASGTTIVIHRIDEFMTAHQAAISPDHAAAPRELAEWVIKRAS